MKNTVAETNDMDNEALDKCLAHAIAQGDIVNFRLLFMPASPFRSRSSEDVHTEKYAYLMPDDEQSSPYTEALQLVRQPILSRYVREQMEKEGPPQLPWELVLALADNALRLGKPTVASQAYELLRIRRRMQQLALDQTDRQLERNNLPAAVRGCRIAAGLDYDYAAFPEPLPTVPNYQESALTLHGIYPATPDQSLALQPDAVVLKTALNFLLVNPTISQRFDDKPETVLVSFVAALIRDMDEHWDAFAARYREAYAIVQRHDALLERINTYTPEALELLFEQLLDSEQMQELKRIPAILCEETTQDWEWWQTLKVLVYRHPGAAVFVARQRLSAREEIVVPRFHPDSALARELGLR